MASPTCTCGQSHPPATHLFTMVADGTGTTAPLRLPAGRWWAVLGSEGGIGGYEVWLIWGGRSVRVDNVANGLHGTALPCFPDAFIQLRAATPGSLYLLAVAE